MQLDEQIREALAGEAASLSAASLERLQAVDYRPRAHAPGPPIGGALLGCALAGAGVTLALALGGSGTQTAFAGWQPTPTAAASDQTGGAEAQCAARLDGGAKSGLGASPAPVLADTRGPYTLLIYEQATCFAGPGFLTVHGEQGSSGVSISTTARSGQPYTIAIGPAPSEVGAVTLSLEDGTSVQATVASSRFAAWWPSASRPTSVAFGTPSGTHTEALSFPPAPTTTAKPARASGASG